MEGALMPAGAGGGDGAELLPLEMAADASWWRLRCQIRGFVV